VLLVSNNRATYTIIVVIGFYNYSGQCACIPMAATKNKGYTDPLENTTNNTAP